MPIDLNTHDATDSPNVQPGTNEAEALCFLYANAEYGFKPKEVRDNTSIPNNSAYKALTRLHDKDLIGRTSDGYYHALTDPMIARYAESLRKGHNYTFSTDPDTYPDEIDNTTSGHPEEPGADEPIIEGGDGRKEPYPEDMEDDS